MTKVSSKSKDGSKGRQGGKRQLHKNVRSAKGRKLSSTRWLERQLNDPYVAAAKRHGYRSRAAYKLMEIDDKYRLLKPGMSVVDLGAAPGGWSQISADRVKVEDGQGKVLAIDLLDIEPLSGVSCLTGDFLDDGSHTLILEALKGRPPDVVLSDMAAPATGHRQTDHLRIINLCEAALDLAIDILAPRGSFLAKVLHGGTEQDLLNIMKHSFKTVRHVKPQASRADSAEIYVLATGFRGKNDPLK